MFEKSNSAITFKEFQDKMNIVNEFENDWGHFYDTDCINCNNCSNIFQNNLYNPKKSELKKIEKKEPFIDIEKQEKQENYKPNVKINNYEDNKLIIVIETIFNCVQITLTTLTMVTMVYFIFKVN